MKKILAIFCFSFFASSAMAGLYIEPYVGAEAGDWTGSVTISTVAQTIDKELSGTNYGLKLGYALLDSTIGFGLDYMSGSGEVEGKLNGVTDTTYDIDYTDMGAFVFLDLPLFLKLQATMFFSSAAERKDDTFSKIELEGSGTKLGLGFTMIPFLSINFEYITINYDEENVAAIDSGDVDRETFMIGISLPIDI